MSQPAKINEQIKKLKAKQDKLLDMQLDSKITEETYILKNNKIEREILELNELKDSVKNEDFEAKTQALLELAGSLYRSYFRVNLD